MILSPPFIALTYIICLLLAGSVFSALILPWTNKTKATLTLLVSFLTGPVFFGLSLGVLYQFTPGRDSSFYLIGNACIWLILLVIARKNTSVVIGAWQDLFSIFFTNLLKPSWLNALKLFLAGFISISFVVIMILPLTGNDPLEYAHVSRTIFELKDLSYYPLVDTDVSRGFYGPWSHPPTNILLQNWALLLQGSADVAGASKITAWYFTAITSLLIAYLCGKLKHSAGIFAALIYISTPLVFQTTLSNHIDPLRMGVFFASFIMLMLANLDHIKGQILVGVFVGASLYTHSFNILNIPMIIAIVFITGNQSFKQKIQISTVISFAALFVISPSYISNLISYGAIIQDAPPLWLVPELAFQDHLSEIRKLDSLKDQILHGVLRGFSDINLFGSSFYLFTIVTLVTLKISGRALLKTYLGSGTAIFENKTSPIFIGITVTLMFFAGVFLSVLLDLIIFTKNARYMMSIHTFLCLGLGSCLMLLTDSRKETIAKNLPAGDV